LNIAGQQFKWAARSTASHARPQNYTCRTADGIFGVGKPIASGMPVSVKTGSVASREEPPCSIAGGYGWGTWDTPPIKPKWMRWRTYERKYERRERAVEKADEEFTIRAARLLKWI
jgi:hypothetical protein